MTPPHTPELGGQSMARLQNRFLCAAWLIGKTAGVSYVQSCSAPQYCQMSQHRASSWVQISKHLGTDNQEKTLG